VTGGHNRKLPGRLLDFGGPICDFGHTESRP
jgi:hypothetical protein